MQHVEVYTRHRLASRDAFPFACSKNRFDRKFAQAPLKVADEDDDIENVRYILLFDALRVNAHVHNIT
jgi:hypothetical protein